MVHPKKVKVGDAVEARMTEPTKLKDGTELPKGTHIVGKVTEVKMKADKEGPSKLGLLFDKAQTKDGKEVPLMMALVSVAPRWEPGGVDPVAADNGASSAGRVSQMSQAAGRTDGSAGGDTLSKGLGVRGAASVSESADAPRSVLSCRTSRLRAIPWESRGRFCNRPRTPCTSIPAAACCCWPSNPLAFEAICKLANRSSECGASSNEGVPNSA